MAGNVLAFPGRAVLEDASASTCDAMLISLIYLNNYQVSCELSTSAGVIAVVAGCANDVANLINKEEYCSANHGQPEAPQSHGPAARRAGVSPEQA